MLESEITFVVHYCLMKCQFDVCLFDDVNRKSLLMNLRTDNCTNELLERESVYVREIEKVMDGFEIELWKVLILCKH